MNVCICVRAYCHSSSTGVVTGSTVDYNERHCYAIFSHFCFILCLSETWKLQHSCKGRLYYHNSLLATLLCRRYGMLNRVGLKLKFFLCISSMLLAITRVCARLPWVADICFFAVYFCCCFVWQNVPFLWPLFSFMYSYMGCILHICVRSFNLVNSPLTRFLFGRSLIYQYSLVQICAFPLEIYKADAHLKIEFVGYCWL